MVILDRFFFHFEEKSDCLFCSDRRLSYTEMIKWELAWVDSVLVFLTSGCLIEVVVEVGLTVHLFLGIDSKDFFEILCNVRVLQVK